MNAKTLAEKTGLTKSRICQLAKKMPPGMARKDTGSWQFDSFAVSWIINRDERKTKKCQMPGCVRKAHPDNCKNIGTRADFIICSTCATLIKIKI